MNISRRNFLIGGASFASLGAFGGNRFRRAAAGFKAGGRPRLRAPEFPEGAKPSVLETVSKNRGGKSNGGKESIPSEKKPAFKVTVPAVAPDDKARLFALEFVARTADGKSQTKLVLPEGFSHPLKHGKAQSSQICCFLKDELGACGVRFTVTPMNCFGARGKPISAEVKA